MLASLSQPLQFFAATAFAGLLIIRLSAHFLAEPAPLAQFAEAANRFLNRFTGTNP
jgi:hypothetical protein